MGHSEPKLKWPIKEAGGSRAKHSLAHVHLACRSGPSQQPAHPQVLAGWTLKSDVLKASECSSPEAIQHRSLSMSETTYEGT